MRTNDSPLLEKVRYTKTQCSSLCYNCVHLKLNEQNKLNKLTDTSCDVTMQVNGESLCLCDNVARFLVSSAIDFRL